MEKSFELFGRAIVVAGVVPALLWLALNIAFFWQPALPLDARLRTLLALEGVVLVISLAGALGALLFALNGAIIHWYEGAFEVQRRWLLRPALRRNQRQHETLYQSLTNLRRMHQEALASLPSRDGRGHSEAQRRADSVLLALDQAHGDLEKQQPDRLLPINKAFVTPTALGNAYAVMEEYPYERYGMDTMVFWPRLIAVLPADYRASIGDQKTTCDFLLNSSLVLFFFAVEAVVVLGLSALGVVPALPAEYPHVALGLAAMLSLAAAYGFYHAAVTETRVLGKLITGAFDLYRHSLLHQFGVQRPPNLPSERRVWQRLAAFIRRGEAFYYPAEAATDAPVQVYQTSSAATQSAEPNMEH